MSVQDPLSRDSILIPRFLAGNQAGPAAGVWTNACGIVAVTASGVAVGTVAGSRLRGGEPAPHCRGAGAAG